MSGSSSCAVALRCFVVIFTLAHVLTSFKENREPVSYYVSTSLWVLGLTAVVCCFPVVPGALVTATLAANLVVCALYYTVVNQGQVSGLAFLLHGGVALALLTLV